MPRAAKDTRLETRTARRNLVQRREPYWRTLYEGCAIGYRKGKKGGAWTARHYSPDSGRRYKTLGAADDLADADGHSVFSFSHAQEKARGWFAELARIDAGETSKGPYTVSDAIRDYLWSYERRTGKSSDRMRYTINAHIEGTLGQIKLSKLRRAQLERWFHELADKPTRRRTPKGEEPGFNSSPITEDGKRRRRASANRCLTILKATLNHAFRSQKVATKGAWDSIRPFRNVDAPVIRYLTHDESQRLVNASGPEIRPLVQAAILTGCRYGELVVLTARDYNSDSRTLFIRTSKGGKPRHVILTDEAISLFAGLTAGKSGADLIFKREDGNAWGKSHQQRPIKEACARARISPAIRFHDLRHTHGSTLAMQGVPMGVIAAQLGHSDTRMTERHYAHLAPNYIAETIRAHFPKLGIVSDNNVISIVDKTGA